MNYNIVKILFGSHMYGLNTPNSDMDYKGIYLPTREELLLGTYKKSITYSSGNDTSRNSADDLDLESYALPYFLKLACQGETGALDMLHAPDKCQEFGMYGDIWKDLVDNKSMFYSKNSKAYIGYLKKQAAKYGIKQSKLTLLEDILTLCDNYINQEFFDPDTKLSKLQPFLPLTAHSYWNGGQAGMVAEEFYVLNGSKMQDNITIMEFMQRVQMQYNKYDTNACWAKDNRKAISHALRVGYQLRDMLTKGTFKYPLDQTAFILSVKVGELDFKNEVSPELERLVTEVEMLIEVSTLPERIDIEYWNKWLLEQYDKYVL